MVSAIRGTEPCAVFLVLGRWGQRREEGKFKASFSFRLYLKNINQPQQKL